VRVAGRWRCVYRAIDQADQVIDVFVSSQRDADENNRVAAGHGRLKARLPPMGGLKQDRNAGVIVAGHAVVQNVRRGDYELAVDEPASRRLATAFEELALAV
jgi:transposase, IS6 family